MSEELSSKIKQILEISVFDNRLCEVLILVGHATFKKTRDNFLNVVCL